MDLLSQVATFSFFYFTFCTMYVCLQCKVARSNKKKSHSLVLLSQVQALRLFYSWTVKSALPLSSCCSPRMPSFFSKTEVNPTLESSAVAA